MNETDATHPASRFQFSIGDAFAAIVSLAIPVAFATNIDREMITDEERNNLWAYILLTGVVGFLIGISYRKAWRSRSPWFLLPFMLSIWCWLLFFYAWDIPNVIVYGMLAYPILCCGLATTAYCIKTRARNPYVSGATVLGIVLLITHAVSLNVSETRISKREMMAAATCKSIAEAQEIFHRKDYDNDGKLEYALDLQSLVETKPGAADLNLIKARLAKADISKSGAQPRHGYYFRILHGQGNRCPGGAKTWQDGNGNLTRAHGALAYPAEYSVTGRNTFLISSTGTIWQEDYGPQTQAIVEKMTEFNPVMWNWMHGE